MKKRKLQDWSRRKRLVMCSAGILAVLYITVIVWQTFKPLPEGLSSAGALHTVEQVEMIYDLSYSQDKEGTETESELRIFNEVYDMIDQAEEFVVIDLFLFDNYNDQDMDFPAVAETLTDHLLDKKEENPDLPLYFITDPLNYGYGSYENQLVGTLEDEGVDVITTDLDKLRDSTPLYSGVYRVIFQWSMKR